MRLFPVPRHARRCRLPLAAGAMALLISACDDPAETSRSEGPWLIGRVTDAAGTPVAGAPVSVAYGFVGYTLEYVCYPWSRLPTVDTVKFSFDLENRAIVDAQILDYMRRPIRTLLHDDLPAGRNYEVVWNETDASGHRVPAGAYTFELRIDEPAGARTLDRRLLLVRCSHEESLASPHTVTDADGRYRIDLRLLPIREAFPAVVNQMDITLVIADAIQVISGIGHGPTLRVAAVDVDAADRSRDLRADLVLP
jgi:hypothetical protein